MSPTSVLVTTLTLVLLGLQYALWLGNGNLLDTWQLHQTVQAQRQENDRRVERNIALEAEVIDLRRGLDAVEERARNELGMIKKDETFVQVIEAK
ncbi:MAG TPA: cell division protein FtsB [Acidiferrobacteraceae bacterium]|nr:cell division protein FtsB [Acidiferrobacteraceae bacterium]